MKEYSYILFDLDGTLTDPMEGITRSVQFALKHFGIEAGLQELCRFIGPPLKDSFVEFYHFSEEEAELAVMHYRKYFEVQGIFENKPYEGIPQLLDDLKSAGKTLLVATSKPTVFAKQILDHFGLAPYFVFVGGSELDGRRTKKAEVIGYVLDYMNILSLQSAVMVGDRKHDILGAKAIGIDSIGVLYGYGDKGELVDAGADYLASDIKALQELLLPL